MSSSPDMLALFRLILKFSKKKYKRNIFLYENASPFYHGISISGSKILLLFKKETDLNIITLDNDDKLTNDFILKSAEIYNVTEENLNILYESVNRFILKQI